MAKKFKSKLIEDDNKPAPKKAPPAADDKEAPAKGASDASGTDADAGDKDTDDSDADGEGAKLKKVVSEIIGDDGDSTEAMEMAQKAYESYKEMGYSADEAMEACGHSVKLAKHMGAKEAKEADDKAKETGDDAQSALEKGDDALSALEAAKMAKEGKGKKEGGQEVPSNPGTAATESERVIKLTAENAKLRESIAKRDAEDHLEKTLRESKLPTHATKVFRKLVEGVKDPKKLDSQFKIFKEAFLKDGSEETESDASKGGNRGSTGQGFAAFLEKQTIETQHEGEGFQAFVEK